METKQYIVVKALIQKNGKSLLLRLSGGDERLAGKYDLPGGALREGEQPSDAVRRHVNAATGLAVQASYLTDVFTYSDAETRAAQPVVIVYVAALSDDAGSVELGEGYDRYVWKKPSQLQAEAVTGLSWLIVNPPSSAKKAEEGSAPGQPEGGASSDLVIYSDGGSRGNPGPSAAGYVIFSAEGELAFEGGAYLGITTNNQAEYHGVHLGLEKARELGARSLEFRLDSLLVVNQLNGVYTIRNRELWPIHERIRTLIGQFDKVIFRHVKREFNQQADGMVNRILDAHGKKTV